MTLLDADAVRKVLTEAISTAGTSATAVAKAIPRDQNYVRDFLKGKKSSLGAAETPRIEAILNLPSGALTISTKPNEPLAPTTRPIPGRRLVGHKNLPIYAAAQGGLGHTIVTFDPIDWVKRPAPLENVRDGYGILITETSMFPAFEPGDTALVNPHLPAIPGADLILYSASELTGDVDSMIKRCISVAAREWKLQQWNPLKEFEIKRADWPISHRVVGKYSAR